jgi:SAM-dependent methyltransferase
VDFQRTSKNLIRDVLGYGGRIPVVREMLTAVHHVRNRSDPWMRRHPFDSSYGATTNGTLPPWLLRSGGIADEHVTSYAGCQPSCLRQALTVIPQPESYTFVDLGCGKGRALILASELPFKRILGIELAPGLVTVARRNARIISQKHPQRTPIETIKGDATAVPVPEGNLVIFLYHSFGPELVARMLSRVTDAVAGTDRAIFFIYENPVYGAMVDAIEEFTRWYGENVPCTANEVGFAPDDSDTVVIWRIGGTSAISPQNGATRPIVVTKAGWRAELGPVRA